MDKQILDRIKKSEQRVVDLYAKVRDLKNGDLELKYPREHYTILELPADQDWSEKRGKALKDLYQKLRDRDWYGADYRHTILLPPGYYYFEDKEPLILNHPGINLMSLTGEADVIFDVNREWDAFAFNQPVSQYYDTPFELEDNLNFLKVGNNIVGQNFGIDSEGIYFNNANQDGESYPVRFPDVISTTSQALYYSVDFIHEHECSDIGFAIWEDGEQPEWGWGSSINTLFKVQISCTNPIEIYGNGVQSTMSIPGGMIIGNKYRLIVDMYPGDFVFVGLVDVTTGNWIVSNWFYTSYPVSQGIDIQAGFAADSEESIMHITAIQGPALTTQFTPCLIVDANDVTVKGIVGYNTGSNNWSQWAEPNDNDSSYNLPIFVERNRQNITLENCIGGPFSFGADPYNGGNGNYEEEDNYQFINCRAPQGYSFGYGVNTYDVTATGCNSLSWDFNNRYFADYCFAPNVELYGTYKDCTVGNNSFIAYELVIDATNCITGQDSFVANSYFDGNFENCKAYDYSFRSENGNIFGIYRNCVIDGVDILYADSNVYAQFYNCWFGDAENLDGTGANCYYCYNNQSDGGITPTISTASFCVDITD
jgi:hypothetical protein